MAKGYDPEEGIGGLPPKFPKPQKAGEYRPGTYVSDDEDPPETSLGTSLQAAGEYNLNLGTQNQPTLVLPGNITLNTDPLQKPFIPACTDSIGQGYEKIFIINSSLYGSLAPHGLQSTLFEMLTPSIKYGKTRDYIRNVTGKTWTKFVPTTETTTGHEPYMPQGAQGYVEIPNTLVFSGDFNTTFHALVARAAKHHVRLGQNETTADEPTQTSYRLLSIHFASTRLGDGRLQMVPFYYGDTAPAATGPDAGTSIEGTTGQQGSALSQMVKWPHERDHADVDGPISYYDESLWTYSMAPPGVHDYIPVYWEPFERINLDNVPYNTETIMVVTSRDPRDPHGNPDPYGKFKGSALQRILDHISAGEGNNHELKYDHCFTYETAYSIDKRHKVASDVYHPVSVDIEANYNYYLPGYEDLISSETMPHSVLPSLLMMAGHEMDTSFGPGLPGSSAAARNRGYHDFVTLGGTISDVFLDSIKTWDSALNAPEHKKAFDYINTGLQEDKVNYFDQWVKAFKTQNVMFPLTYAATDLFRDRVVRNARRWNSSIIFLGSDPNVANDASSPSQNNIQHRYFTNDYESRKHMFPMQSTIKITTQSGKAKSHELLELLHSTNLVYPLLKSIKEKISGEIRDHEEIPVFWDDGAGRADYSSNFFDMYNVGRNEEGFEWGSREVLEKNSMRFYGKKQLAAPATTKEPLTGITLSAGSPVTRSTWVSSYIAGDSIYKGSDPLIAPVNEDIQKNVEAAHWSLFTGTEYDPDTASGYKGITPDYNTIPNQAALIDKLNALVRKKTRTYEQIIDGAMACTETLFWRVEKLLVKKVGDEIKYETVQNFLLTDPMEIDEIRLVDTQIKYGESYIYKIYAWKAVFGTEYRYEPLKGKLKVFSVGPSDMPEDMHLLELYGSGGDYEQKRGSEAGSPAIADIEHDVSFPTLNHPGPAAWQWGKPPEWQLILNVNSWPSIKLIECPWFNSLPVTVRDKPPLPPHAKFIQYQAIDNTYLIHLQPAYGRALKYFDFIYPEDIEKFKEMYMNQRLAELAGIQGEHPLMVFESDDPPASFEVFVIGPDPITDVTTPPESYLDFSKGKRTEILLENAASATYRPTIKPNKKYYYTCRSVDIHGNVSYPSPIYEVQLINDSGAIYLVSNIYQFEKSKKIMKKSMRKFLNVVPTMEQSTIPDIVQERHMKSYVHVEPAVGDREHRLFNNGKKYKIRLTSKNSGKKIDINVGFKTTRVTTKFDTIYIDTQVSFLPGGLPGKGLPKSYTTQSTAEPLTPEQKKEIAKAQKTKGIEMAQNMMKDMMKGK